MGQNELLLIGLFAVAVAVPFMLRANAALVYLSMCTGYAVGQLLTSDIQEFMQLFSPGLTANAVRLGLIVVPGLVTGVFYLYSARGIKRLINLLPSLAVGCLTVTLVVPLLTDNLSRGMTSLALWQQFARLQPLLIGGGAILCLVLLWLQRPSLGKAPASKKRSSQD